MTIRWFVEVSPVDGSALGERYCVEALQWQQALQQARKIRGDRGPLARFAMELLEVGYRATDPTSRLRYTVSRAPADAPLSRPPTAPHKSNGSASGSISAIPRPSSEPEIEELSNPMLVALPPPLETNYEDALPTMPQASEVPPPAAPVVYETRPSEAPRSVPARPSQIPLPRKSTRARNIQTSPAVPRPNRSHPPSTAATADAIAATSSVHTGGAAAPNLSAVPAEEPVPTLPGLTLLSHRREEPTEAVPILYREYAMAFDSNLSPRELERYARAIWEQVRTNIGHRPPGKFVQVALFDHRFADKPERAPAAVLAWKDWRGDPIIRIRKTKSEPAASDAPFPPESVTAPAIPVVERPVPLAAADLVSDPTAADGPPPPPLEFLQSGSSTVDVVVPLVAQAPSAEPNVAIPLTAPADVAIPLTAPAAIPLTSPIDSSAVARAEAEAVAIEAEPLQPSIVETGDVRAAAIVESPLADPGFPAGSFPPPASSMPVLRPPVAPPMEPKVPTEAPAPVATVAPVEASVDPVAPAPIAAVAPATPSEPPSPRAMQGSSPSHRRTPPPRSSGNAVRRRGSSEDLIGELFEEMHQLHFMPDIVAGADYVLSCVLFMLPCEGVLIHVFDINAREFVVVRAAGPTFREALMSKTPDTYPLFREAFRRAGTLSFPSTDGDERFAAERFQRLGIQVKSALVGAVQHGGRYLGIIELLNPLGGEPFRVSEVNALDYICEQFADLVASRPVVLDEDAVLPKA